MILDDIVADKRCQIQQLRAERPLEAIKEKVSALGNEAGLFLKALTGGTGTAVIAEIKRKSPSKGVLREDFDAVAIARSFEKSGARALSVLTDEKYFGGSEEILSQVRRATRLPLLRKDFTLDEYQVWESKLLGADAVLLIAAILTQKELAAFGALAERLGLSALFEVHDAADVDKILPLAPKLIGINNRDLRTFDVDIRVTEKLIGRLPSGSTVVSESGIQSGKDLIYLKGLGVKAVLVGESLMREKDPGAALAGLLRDGRG